MTFELLLAGALLLYGYLAWHRYQYAVLLAVVLIPSYLLRTTFFEVPTNYFELSVATLVAVGLAQPSVRQRWYAYVRHVPRAFLILVTLFLIACALATIISAEPEVSLGILKGWVITPLLLALLAAGTLTTPVPQQRLLHALLLSGVGVAAIALTQFSWGERLRGMYDVPNSLALWLAPLFVTACWQGLRSRRYAIAALMLGIALLATQSAAALVAVVTTLAFGAARWRAGAVRRQLLLGIAACAVVGTVYLSATDRLSYLLQPWTVGTPNSLSVRMQLWSVAVELIQEHPIAGVGLGQFEPAYQLTLHERFAAGRTALSEFVFRDPHNWLLSFWLNTGLLGLTSFAAIQIYALSQGLKSAAPRYARAAALGLVTLLIFGLVDTIFWKNDLAVLQWLLVVVALSSATIDRAEQAPAH